MVSFLRRLKDPLAGATHFLAVLLALPATTWLLWKAAQVATGWHLVSFAVFGAGMILLYSASTLYHWLPDTPRLEAVFRRLDHMMIFVLIAATYTPICLVPLRGGWGWSLLGIVWGIALTGIVMKTVWIQAPAWLSTLMYLFMGWLVVIGLKPLTAALSAGALFWLTLGGVFYTLGAIIYAVNRPNPWPRWLGAHEIFHLLTMAGTGAHVWLMARYVMTLNGEVNV
ncbi:MAG: hemolysin III family protein [Candidatus Neomarinimicrobiota bacterium]|nr:MAG: hemolysin III family protein [Candidatus Neomarinimicrobiota bacterium]